eukprot:gene24149-29209_t
MFVHANSILSRRTRSALQLSRSLLRVPASTIVKADIEIAGLLEGASNTYFSTNLNIANAAKLVQNSDAIFRRAIAKDVESSGKDALLYLRELNNKASHYLKEDAICGRSEICADIKNTAILNEGSFAFITGGRSVGKSKIFRSLAKAIGEFQSKEIAIDEASEHTRVSVVMLCGRENTDLVRALDEVASEALLSSAAANNLPSFISSGPGLAVDFDFWGINFAGGTIAEAVGALAMNHPQNTNHTVLILDEADSFLQCTDKDTPDKQAAAKELFNAAVLYTKELRHMSVLLVSSDERLPFHIRNLGVNPCHITHTFVINEPTPRECLDLLQKQFGVGEHLSSALLDCYGGNVYEMCMFLIGLPHAYESVRSKIDIFMGPATYIGKALYQWKTEKGGEAEIRKVLEELARTGFVPMQSSSKLAQLLTKLNICVFLADGAEEYQVPTELRAQRAGLIPASQLLRVLIAWELAQEY